MLELVNVSKAYGSKTIVASADLALEKGTVLCLSGPSGIGKSTLINIAAGLERPDSGTVKRDSDRLGFAFQTPALLPWKSALDNLKFAMSGRRDADVSRAVHWLGKLGLQEAAHQKPRELSGGMRKRLGLAASLVTGPELLFLDEPFAFLDDEWRRTIAGELKTLNAEEGLTILMASHELEPLERLDAEILFLNESPVSIRRC